MRVRRTSHAARLRGLARYLVLRATGGRRVHTEGPVYIGPRRLLFAEGEGAALRLGRKVHIAHDVELQARGAELVIGEHTTINPYSRVVAFDGIRIGSHVAPLSRLRRRRRSTSPRLSSRLRLSTCPFQPPQKARSVPRGVATMTGIRTRG